MSASARRASSLNITALKITLPKDKEHPSITTQIQNVI